MMIPSVLPGRGFGPLARQSSLLFHFESRDLSLRAITGENGVFSRASVGTTIDPLGRVITVPSGQPRFTWIGGVPYLLLEQDRTNLVRHSENFGTTWDAQHAPTRVAAAHTKSGVSLDLLGDNDAGQPVHFSQNIAFTGDAEKAISVFMRRGPSPPPDGTVIFMRDTTAVQTRLQATITWSPEGIPTVTMQTGTHLATNVLTDGVYRFLFRSSAVTAANTNQLRVYIAGLTAGGTGDVYVGGVQAEDASVPSSYIKTEGSTAARTTEALYFPFLSLPRAMTVYVRFVEVGSILLSTSARIIQIGSSDPSATPRFFMQRVGTGVSNYQTAHNPDSGVTVTSTLSTPPSLLQRVEVAGALMPDGAVRSSISIDEGEIVTLNPSSIAPGVPPAWAGGSDVRLWVNSASAAANIGLIALESIKIAAGVRSLEYMRSAF